MSISAIFVHSNITVTHGGRTTINTFKKLVSATSSNSRTLYRTDTKFNWNEDEMAAMKAERQSAMKEQTDAALTEQSEKQWQLRMPTHDEAEEANHGAAEEVKAGTPSERKTDHALKETMQDEMFKQKQQTLLSMAERGDAIRAPVAPDATTLDKAYAALAVLMYGGHGHNESVNMEEMADQQRHDEEAEEVEAKRAEFTRLKREKLAAQMDRNAKLAHTLKRVAAPTTPRRWSDMWRRSTATSWRQSFRADTESRLVR